MKERPILFSGEMVRALLREENPKTQTRRLVKRTDSGRVKAIGSARNWHLDDPCAVLACPYGQPGDRLWVRENYRLLAKMDCVSPGNAVDSTRWFEADGMPPVAFQTYGKIRPSIHMPRWASRITLEVGSVRVERLQDISEEDALAEGIFYQKPTAEDIKDGATDGVYIVPGLTQPLGQPMWAPTAALAYRFLWESINGPASWDANPWVWVVTFRRINP